MAAFAGAVELGAHFIELDVRRCRSGELIVLHDTDFRRTGGEDARVADLDLKETQSIDVGHWFAPTYRGQYAPTLVEVVETWREQIRFNIEVKEEGPRGDGSAAALGALIQKMDLAGDAIVSSFNPFSLARVRAHCDVPVGLLFPPDSGNPVQDRLFGSPWAAPFIAAYAWHPADKVTSEALIRKAHLRGLGVNVWTVDHEPRIRQLIGWKANGIITNRPDLALKIVAELDPLRARAKRSDP